MIGQGIDLKYPAGGPKRYVPFAARLIDQLVLCLGLNFTVAVRSVPSMRRCRSGVSFKANRKPTNVAIYGADLGTSLFCTTSADGTIVGNWKFRRDTLLEFFREAAPASGNFETLVAVRSPQSRNRHEKLRLRTVQFGSQK